MKYLVRLLLVLIPILLISPRYLQYRKSIGLVPPGVRLAGQVIATTATESQIRDQLTQVYGEPVPVYVGAQRLILRPSAVGYQADVPAMLTAAQNAGQGTTYWLNFARSLLSLPPASADIPLTATWDNAALDVWLAEAAQQTDRTPVTASADPNTLQFSAGRPGQSLDQATAHQLIVAALGSSENRQARLVIRASPAPPPSLDVLRDLLSQQFEAFPGVATLFVRDLETGEEISLNGDTPFSAIGTMKSPIVLQAVYAAHGTLDSDTLATVSETIHLGDNAGANRLLEQLGKGDSVAGARAVTEQLHRLDLPNSYIAGPYDRGVNYAQQPTPANQNAKLNTRPDPAMQTTAKDMGIFMGMLADCSEGKGNLLAALSDGLDAGQCRQIVTWLEDNHFDVLMEAGLPPGTRFARKHSFSPETHADTMIVWGAQGRYIVSTYLYRAGWLEENLSAALMKTIAKATWNFFALRATIAKPP